MNKSDKTSEFEKQLLKGLKVIYRYSGLKVIYRYSGLEIICNKARVTEEQHPKKILPSLPLWLTGIYIALFGLASQRFENRVDIIERKTTKCAISGITFKPDLLMFCLNGDRERPVRDSVALKKGFTITGKE